LAAMRNAPLKDRSHSMQRFIKNGRQYKRNPLKKMDNNKRRSWATAIVSFIAGAAIILSSLGYGAAVAIEMKFGIPREQT